MQLLNILNIKGTITLKSGLHIGAGDVEMHIGGTDNPIIKHPNTQEPYIPGSSIKGKVRSLLELKSGLVVKTDGNPLSARLLKGLKGEERQECETILKLFGSSGADGEAVAELGPSRVSFADCPITKNWQEKVRQSRWSLTEVKSENSINRIKGTAENPRFTERVPSDTEFAFSVCLKVLKPEEEQPLLEALLQGLKLLELDALGGSGSRGYGKVQFRFEDESIQKRFESIDLFSRGGKL
ncbi:type III-A CRISPR-associated RAMP protein Csm3 [Desulforhabdus amnigena]|uniref:CRISPR system Cms endoribonuclease Csm3 n=1 Tax=Desulforhabdus amnigena TaxID=40218 RepID=A0A9W6D1T7_9BACT|nr:type III-A CRISPR-associated RAMP protein Csm3 [Desulforhabdus amnigena]GLI34305.1 type III-A CRISPR-associated RAMP protein Csm3 [Desulforhabdus amnigena]